MSEGVRVDKWLWAVRLYKTRTMATDACKKGKILVDGEPVKPSRALKIGDVILVRKMPVIYTYKVTGLLEKRQSAKIAVEHYEDLTPEEEMMKLDANKFFGYEKREKGTGRPTKKDRRIIDNFKKNI